MKTKEIEAAAIEGIDPDNLKRESRVWGEYKHRANDFKAGAEWALEQVRKYTDLEAGNYDNADDVYQAMERVDSFCTIED